MPFSTIHIVPFLFIALLAWPWPASAQLERDYIFTDEEGHLILRFTGNNPDALAINLQEEIQNSQLSTMVHDRLQADTAFDAEPAEPLWAKNLETLVSGHLKSAGTRFSPASVECKSVSCRLRLDHAGGRRVADHQQLMGEVQAMIEDFEKAYPGSVAPAFLIAGQYQEPGAPYIKVFLRRAD